MQIVCWKWKLTTPKARMCTFCPLLSQSQHFLLWFVFLSAFILCCRGTCWEGLICTWYIIYCLYQYHRKLEIIISNFPIDFFLIIIFFTCSKLWGCWTQKKYLTKKLIINLIFFLSAYHYMMRLITTRIVTIYCF